MLASQSVPLERRPAAILFNVSAPIGAIIAAKLRRQKVVLRIDGLYFDRLSKAFLATFKWPLRPVFSLGLKYSWAHDFLADIANLLNQNYKAFARVLLADLVIYQSKFSRDVHMRYFPNKPHRVVVNGAIYQGNDALIHVNKGGDAIRLITIYDGESPRKRIHDLVGFVKWANESKKMPIHLCILGYTGQVPACAPPGTKSIIEDSPYIETLPWFSSFSKDIRNALFGSDMYITFTFRDPCPNVVVEAMAHGLPVVGVESGGVPDIVADAGVLLPAGGNDGSFFSAWRYECDFPPIEYERAFEAILDVRANSALFRSRVRDRFVADLGIDVVAGRYVSAMRSLLRN